MTENLQILNIIQSTLFPGKRRGIYFLFAINLFGCTGPCIQSIQS